MFVVFDECNLVWGQARQFPDAQRLANYLLALGHTPRVEYNPPYPLTWRSKANSAPGKECCS